MSNKCVECKNEFGWLGLEYYFNTVTCRICNKVAHNSCGKTIYCLRCWSCVTCYKKIYKGIDSINPIVRKNNSLQGYTIKKSYNKITAQFWEKKRDRRTAVDNLRYQAWKVGADAIIDLKFVHEQKFSGNYEYTAVLPSAIPVSIKKITKTKNKKINVERNKKETNEIKDLKFPKDLPDIPDLIK
tara:strand:+ start:92 stop:646 length:555 start_codon:yes stop_codon:yes gene_type:complete